MKIRAGDAKSTTGVEWGPGAFRCNSESQWAWSIDEVVCPAGQMLWQIISFPQCWDGVNLDSPDYKSHMAHPAYLPNNTKGNVWCPMTHSKIIAQITISVLYRVLAEGSGSWRLASDPATGPRGLTNHADWMNDARTSATRGARSA